VPTTTPFFRSRNAKTLYSGSQTKTIEETEKIFEDFNVLNIELSYLKTITIYLKKHNQLDSINHGVNTRYAASKFSLDWPLKTSCRKVNYFFGTQILNLMPNDMVNLQLPIFKKKKN